jgi:hypothetical protein
MKFITTTRLLAKDVGFFSSIPLEKAHICLRSCGVDWDGQCRNCRGKSDGRSDERDGAKEIHDS